MKNIIEDRTIHCSCIYTHTHTDTTPPNIYIDMEVSEVDWKDTHQIHDNSYNRAECLRGGFIFISNGVI